MVLRSSFVSLRSPIWYIRLNPTVSNDVSHLFSSRIHCIGQWILRKSGAALLDSNHSKYVLRTHNRFYQMKYFATNPKTQQNASIVVYTVHSQFASTLHWSAAWKISESSEPFCDIFALKNENAECMIKVWSMIMIMRWTLNSNFKFPAY